MTKEECIALLNRYAEYNGMGIPNLAGCREAMRTAAELLQQEQPELPGIEAPGIPGKDFIPVEWVDACEMYGKWKIVKQEQPEVDLKNL